MTSLSYRDQADARRSASPPQSCNWPPTRDCRDRAHRACPPPKRDGRVTWSDSVVLRLFKRVAKELLEVDLSARLDIAVAWEAVAVDALELLSGYAGDLVGGLGVLRRNHGRLVCRNVDGLGGFPRIATDFG